MSTSTLLLARSTAAATAATAWPGAQHGFLLCNGTVTRHAVRQMHTSLRLYQQQQSSSAQSTSSGKPATTFSPPLTTSKVADAVLQDHHEPGWAMHHATYTEHDLDSVKVVHRNSTGFGDRLASFMVACMRYIFDVATRYPKHRKRYPHVKGSEHAMVKVGFPRYEEQSLKKGVDGKADLQKEGLPESMELGEMRKRGLSFGPDDWLVRIVFLESVAGVPGMVAAACRHLHSLRLLRRDKGWINTMLADAANERQHLLIALKMYEPGWLMRTFLILTQGVFWNFFFIFYLLAPRIAHRFVGVLEEEAVLTYSRIIDDIQQGRLPEWQAYPAPRIAIDYWGLAKDADMLDVIRAYRADEANHRFVNHTMAELKADDFNPFAYGDAPPAQRGVTWGLTRDEAIAYFEREDAKRRALEGGIVTDSKTSNSHSSSDDVDSSNNNNKEESQSQSKAFAGRDGIPL